MADPIDDILANRDDRDFWNSTLANIAQVVASIPERKARAQAQQADAEYRAARLDMSRQELADKKQQRMAQQLVNGIAAKYIKPSDDGSYQTIDRVGLAKALAEAGQPPETMLHYSKMIDEFDSSAKKFADAKSQNIADTAASILRSNENPSAAEVAFGLGLAKKNHPDITDEQLAPFYDAIDSGKTLKPALVQILTQFDREGKHKDLAKAKEPDKPVVVSPGGTLVEPSTGKVVFTAPAKAADVNVGSFEDYVTRKFGANPTPAQITQARKEYNQADDRPPVNIRLPSGLTPGQALTQTRQLRNEYQRETKSAKTVNQQLALMRSSIQAVREGKSTAGSQGVLVTFQKILDPNSVVRESEYARSAAGLSLLGRIEGAWDRIKQGGAGVTVKDLEQFVSLAEQFAKSQNEFAAQSKAQIDALAKEYGLKSELITSDPGDVTGIKPTAPKRTTNPYPK